MRRPVERALRLTVFVAEGDLWHHKPLYHEIVRRAREAGLAGASVFRGVEGYGVHSRIHTQRVLSLDEAMPLAVVIVDVEDRIRTFLPELEELVGEGMAELERVEMIRYDPDELSAAGA